LSLPCASWIYRDGAPPELTAVCQQLNFSDEKGSYLLNRLKVLGIVDTVKSGFSDRIVVADHLAIEDLPRNVEESRLEQELKKFQTGQKRHGREGRFDQSPAES
jgi:hypothetical protein